MSSDWFLSIIVVTCAIAIGLGVALPAAGQARAATQALRAIARQPDEAPTISRTLFVGLAMLESLALYILIVVLVLLFANPLLAQTVQAGSTAAWFLVASAVAAPLAIVGGTMAAALGQGRVTGAALEAIAEQPQARDSISTSLFIALALLESLALYALIVALILLFANPLLSRVLGT